MAVEKINSYSTDENLLFIDMLLELLRMYDEIRIKYQYRNIYCTFDVVFKVDMNQEPFEFENYLKKLENNYV